MVIGVDNGISGAWCALDANGSIAAYGLMPLTSFGKKKEIDPALLLQTFCEHGATLVAVEEPLHFSRTLQSMRSMALSFGKILGVCAAAELPVKRVQVRDWQNAKLGRFARGQSKPAALRAARKIWPAEKFSTSKRGGAHDGIVDAALIGHYALGL
jgi:hypothetical protein